MKFYRNNISYVPIKEPLNTLVKEGFDRTHPQSLNSCNHFIITTKLFYLLQKILSLFQTSKNSMVHNLIIKPFQHAIFKLIFMI